jgi:abortive infection bacteriophage resistance protein
MKLAFHTADPFAYADDPSALPGLLGDKRTRFIKELDDVLEKSRKSREPLAEHFQKKYGDVHKYMPIWMAAELMSFGCIVTMFQGSSPTVKKEVSAAFGVHDVVLESWLLTLNTIRNICAHHARLWNRVLGFKPKIPHRPEWRVPSSVDNAKLFCVLTILQWCIRRIAPQSAWKTRLRDLCARYPTIPLVNMGFPTDWDKIPIWA